MTRRLVPLKNIAGINERALGEGTDPDYTFRYVDIGTVGRGELVAEPQEMRFEDSPSRARRLVSAGDTIVSTVRTYLRAVWPVPDAADGLVVSTGFAVLTPRNVDPRYFSWWVRSDPFIEGVVARSVGVSYPAINALELGDLKVGVPSAAEQRAIADFLDTETARIDALITKKRSLNDLLEERLDSLVEELVWRRPDSADRWDAVPLRRVASRVDVGIAEAASHAYVGKGVPLVRSTNIRPNLIETEGMLFLDPEYAATQRRKVVRAGDILTVRTGSTGVSAVVPDSLDGCQTFTQLISTVRPPHLSEFVTYALNSLTGREYFELLRWGSAQDNISVPTLAACPIPFADASAQESAVRRIRKARAAVGALRLRIQRQLRLLQEHRQALITAAVTGGAEVPGVAA